MFSSWKDFKQIDNNKRSSMYDCTFKMFIPLNWKWTFNLFQVLWHALMTVPSYGDNGLMYKIYNHGIAFRKKVSSFLKVCLWYYDFDIMILRYYAIDLQHLRKYF